MKTARASKNVNTCCGKQTISTKSTKVRYNIQLNLIPQLRTNSTCISPSHPSDKILIEIDLMAVIAVANMKKQRQQKGRHKGKKEDNKVSVIKRKV